MIKFKLPWEKTPEQVKTKLTEAEAVDEILSILKDTEGGTPAHVKVLSVCYQIIMEYIVDVSGIHRAVNTWNLVYNHIKDRSLDYHAGKAGRN